MKLNSRYNMFESTKIFETLWNLRLDELDDDQNKMKWDRRNKNLILFWKSFQNKPLKTEILTRLSYMSWGSNLSDLSVYDVQQRKEGQ